MMSVRLESSTTSPNITCCVTITRLLTTEKQIKTPVYPDLACSGDGMLIDLSLVDKSTPTLLQMNTVSLILLNCDSD